MKRKALPFFFMIIMLITLTSCSLLEEKRIEDKEEEMVIEEEEENIPYVLINCEDCVFAFYNDHKHFGDVLTEYTKDFRTLKDKNGKQRKRFMGHMIDQDGSILKAYACGIEKGKVYCLEGSSDSRMYEANIKVLNEIFQSSQCERNDYSYSCFGETSGEVKIDGFVSVYYDENCHTNKNGEFYCN